MEAKEQRWESGGVTWKGGLYLWGLRGMSGNVEYSQRAKKGLFMSMKQTPTAILTALRRILDQNIIISFRL